MKFQCNREQLADALQSASRALSSRSSVSGIKWTGSNGWLQLEGRESDMSIQSVIPYTGVETSFTTPASLALDLVKSMQDEMVEVLVDESVVAFRSGRAEVSLNLLTEFESPTMPLPEGNEVTVQGGELARGIHQVAVAGSRDEGRDLVYSGMLFASTGEGLRLVATDGIRLALRDVTGLDVMMEADQREVVIPTRAVRELERLLSSNSDGEGLRVRIGRHEAMFSIGDTKLVTRLIDEPFRDYRRLTDVTYHRVLLADKLQLQHSLRTLRRMAKEARNSCVLRMSISDNNCELSVKIPQIGQVHEVIDVNFSDLEFSIGFDPDLFAEGIDGVETDVVRIEFQEPNRAACITNSDSRAYIYLLMPIVQKS